MPELRRYATAIGMKGLGKMMVAIPVLIQAS